tara:strand:- start:2012 stop:3592 length:1581 start_codon:yes stop_codon:yes gene_type:complete
MKRLLFFLIIILIHSCKKEESKTTYLGVVDLTVNGHADAIPQFEKGLLLLHSFEYQDAREAFYKAQEIDSIMAMAYWGEAMTHNHSLWGEQNYEDGFAAVEKIKGIKEKNNLSSLEKDLLHAVEILYKPKTSKKDRDQNYMQYMQDLYKKYPDNHEIAAFYSLSLLGSVAEGRNDSIYGLGANIANKIIKDNAKHPGALHYLIHSYDDPDHAHLALEAANSYAKVAPDASHALHMPSHIYVALGMWDRVIASNIDSYQASVNRMESRDLDNDARGYHAYHWLEYGYLQKGEIQVAEKMVFDMQNYCNDKPSARARAHLMFLKGTFLAETNLWDNAVADIDVDVSNLNIAVQSQNHFIDGMLAYKTNNKAGLDTIIESMSSNIKKESLLVDNIKSGFTLCASASRSTPDQKDIKTSEIMMTQLKALKAWMNNDLENAEKLLKESVNLQNQLSYSYGPPFIQKPTQELYAEFLIAQNRPQEAIELYKSSLKKGTKRLAALKGIKKSAELLGDDSLIKKIDLELSKIYD